MKNVVPVVYGSNDVHKVAPPHSYIDVRDFTSPQHLAQYLLYLDKNNTEYVSYFYWKKHYEVISGHYSMTHVFCMFCKFLHQNNTIHVLDDFKEWFYNRSGCRENDIFPWIADKYDENPFLTLKK